MDPRQRNALYLAVVAVLLLVAWWQFWPPGQQIRRGLDIQGGLSVILTARPGEGQTLTNETMDRAETIITNRVNGLGVSEAEVQRQGNDSLLVQLPGIEDPEAALDALGSTGQLEFVDVQSLPETIAAGIQEGMMLPEGTYEPFMTGDVITSASPGTDQAGQIVVNVSMNARGTEVWRDFTARNVGNRVAIVLDGTVQSAPVIQEAIPSGQTQISGQFTADEAKQLSAVLEAGALPVNLDFSESRVVGPTLGQESLRQGVIAALIGLGLVAVYLAVYYRGLGLIAVLSLVVFGIIFLGVLGVLSKMGQFALTLPGIAGIVLTVGLAADSSILLMERFKEEARMGKTLRSAAKTGTLHGFGTSVDGDVVTFVTALVLFVFAIGPVRGFALTLMIGLVIDLAVAWLFTRPAIMIAAESALAKTPALFGVRGGGTDAA